MLLATSTNAAPACGAGSKLNSTDLALDAVNISSAADGSINVVLTGHLTSGNNSPSRTLKRTIWPRSAAVGP